MYLFFNVQSISILKNKSSIAPFRELLKSMDVVLLDESMKSQYKIQK